MQMEAESGQVYVRCAESHVLSGGSTFTVLFTIARKTKKPKLGQLGFPIRTPEVSLVHL